MISRITWIKRTWPFYRSERNSRCAILLVLIQKSIENLDYFSDYFSIIILILLNTILYFVTTVPTISSPLILPKFSKEVIIACLLGWLSTN